ncbi:hypothetical protein [Silvimonas iriomotensis]|uniref:FHA domain-containing protein n=1 Tax=Silvimonas iriomotensis TaxID=449662 RepID=A0ABQ2PC43_9NEIS|nr:hypothetical protein [Silvimonas iriomotensis]GGP23027.1 hypothetical protein GCM10010970_30270 [Silvimonas iriomotensis]
MAALHSNPNTIAPYALPTIVLGDELIKLEFIIRERAEAITKHKSSDAGDDGFLCALEEEEGREIVEREGIQYGRIKLYRANGSLITHRPKLRADGEYSPFREDIYINGHEFAGFASNHLFVIEESAAKAVDAPQTKALPVATVPTKAKDTAPVVTVAMPALLEDSGQITKGHVFEPERKTAARLVIDLIVAYIQQIPDYRLLQAKLIFDYCIKHAGTADSPFRKLAGERDRLEVMLGRKSIVFDTFKRYVAEAKNGKKTQQKRLNQ